jgi:hypothetical protein
MHALKCTDCRCRPWDMGEDFYVTDGLWILTIPSKKREDIICLECFEKRLGRKLCRVDFKPWFRNNRWYGDRKKSLNNPPSARLIDRLQLPFDK